MSRDYSLYYLYGRDTTEYIKFCLVYDHIIHCTCNVCAFTTQYSEPWTIHIYTHESFQLFQLIYLTQYAIGD